MGKRNACPSCGATMWICGGSCTPDPFAHVSDDHRARIEALLSLPEGARRALWELDEPGWYYSKNPVASPKVWHEELVVEEPIARRDSALQGWEHVLGADNFLWCPCPPTDVLRLAADAVQGWWRISHEEGRLEVEVMKGEDANGCFEHVWGSVVQIPLGHGARADNHTLLLAALDVLGQVWRWKEKSCD